MQKQSFKNHIRYYTPHHFIFYPVLVLFLAASIWFGANAVDPMPWIFISVIFLFLFASAFMLRQHYALVLQNRIVRLELRYRYYTLTGERMELLDDNLSDGQLFALRFASDAELPSLLHRTINENLSGIQIKQAIISWRGDYNRV
jgi:hypothetical protein